MAFQKLCRVEFKSAIYAATTKAGNVFFKFTELIGSREAYKTLYLRQHFTGLQNACIIGCDSTKKIPTRLRVITDGKTDFYYFRDVLKFPETDFYIKINKIFAGVRNKITLIRKELSVTSNGTLDVSFNRRSQPQYYRSIATRV